MEGSSAPQAIAIKLQGMKISNNSRKEIKTASSYIPRSSMPDTANNTDWMSSSCGETPFLNDDIRDWRHFRLRVRKGSVNDHLESHNSKDPSPKKPTNGFGDFYFDGKDPSGRTPTHSNLSSSVPVSSKPIMAVGSCPAVVLNLPSLTPVSNTGSELMAQNISTPRQHERTQEIDKEAAPAPMVEQLNNSAEDSIFDLEM